MEAELERLALYDPLTGLPNRALFADRLRHVLGRRGRPPPPRSTSSTSTASSASTTRSATRAGDDVLREVARRLRGVLRPEDTVARFGGDEFTILCETVGGVLEAVSIADRLQRPLLCRCGPAARSCGCQREHRRGACEPGEGVDGERLIEDADAAMYRAKERGGARTELFDIAHARPRGGVAGDRAGAPAGAGAGRAAPLLPAGGRPHDGRGRGRRGARALAAPRARPARPRTRSSRWPRRPA